MSAVRPQSAQLAVGRMSLQRRLLRQKDLDWRGSPDRKTMETLASSPTRKRTCWLLVGGDVYRWLTIVNGEPALVQTQDVGWAQAKLGHTHTRAVQPTVLVVLDRRGCQPDQIEFVQIHVSSLRKGERSRKRLCVVGPDPCAHGQERHAHTKQKREHSHHLLRCKHPPEF